MMRYRAGFVLCVLLILSACDNATTLPTEPTPASLFSCLFGASRTQAVGEVVLFEGARGQTLCLEGGSDVTEYLYVPFYAADVGTARIQLHLSGFGPEINFAGSSAAQVPFFAADTMLPDDRFHISLRQREIEELTPHLPLSASPATMNSTRLGSAAGLPQVGDLLLLNTSARCDVIDQHVGRVEAISRTAVIVADTSNPTPTFTQEDWRFFGEAFDTLVNPVATENFGEPTDIDDNDRVIVFFTRAVNDLTPVGANAFVGGFFWAGDLFPNAKCAGSNTAEIFYLLTPDAARADLGQRAFEPAFVKRITVGTLGHEYQHLINAGRRIYINNARSFEEVWLNEGISHIAEELLFYEATELQPRQNIDLQTLRETQHRLLSFAAYQQSNFGRFLQYLKRPDTVSLFGVDDLPTRGASWAFLRFAADQENGPDAPFFRTLVNGTEAGVANLDNALEQFDALALIQAWTVSVFTDDTDLPVDSIYTQPSWNFRSIMPAFVGGPEGEYPLHIIKPAAGQTQVLTLAGGGAAFVRFGVQAGTPMLLRSSAGGAALPSSLRISLVRIR